MKEEIYKVKITNRVNFGFWKGCGIIAIALLMAEFTMGNSIGFDNPFAFFGLVLVIWFLNLLLCWNGLKTGSSYAPSTD